MGGCEDPSIANQTATAGVKLILGFFQDEKHLPWKLVGCRLHSADNFHPGTVIRRRRIANATNSVWNVCQIKSDNVWTDYLNKIIPVLSIPLLNELMNAKRVPVSLLVRFAMREIWISFNGAGLTRRGVESINNVEINLELVFDETWDEITGRWENKQMKTVKIKETPNFSMIVKFT